jgi:uncharacterized protein
MKIAALALPDSSDAELRAYDTVCERLAGFDDGLSFETVDGFLTALAAGPLLPAADDWLPALCGDAFERAFADPEDHAQGLAALQARLKVLCRQLDPEALLDQPEQMRLLPLVAELTDDDRQRAVDEIGMTAEDAACLQTGAAWAQGFLDAVDAFPAIWVEPTGGAATIEFRAHLDQVAALLLPPGSDEAREHNAIYWPQGEPDREDLLAEACWAVQDLRLYWVDHAPKPPTRRVAPAPGRNDPCPCGSGRKYKKCCGSAAAA